MKKPFALTLALALFLFFFSQSTAQNTYIPDDHFEQALIDLGYDSGELNDSVPTANIDTISRLDISGKSISDLSGIEDFASLTFLNCSNNNLTTLNITSNISLLYLTFRYNQISSIDLHSNTNLIELMCKNNNLTELDLSLNSSLRLLDCSNNQLTELDLNRNSALSFLQCFNNKLRHINIKNGFMSTVAAGKSYLNSENNPELYCIEVDNVENASAYFSWYKDVWSEYTENCTDYKVPMVYIPDDNFELALINQNFDPGELNDSVPATSIKNLLNLDINDLNITNLTGIEYFNALERLFCYNNQITELDLTANKNLREINCSYNYLSSLDLSQNSRLYYVIVHDNQLTELNFRNGNNNNSYLDSRSNPNLYCIQVDDPTAAVSYSNWHKDGQAVYSADCNEELRMTYIPDDNFEQALIDLGYDFGDLDDSVSSNAIELIKSISFYGKSISDFTGIEDFTSLESLNCRQNQLSTLDLSKLVNLKSLECTNNKLISLNVSNSPNLQTLYCADNQLTSLDLTQNQLLKKINCSYNQIVDLDLSSNVELTELNCSFNKNLSGLNLKNGNNDNLSLMNAFGTQNLLCIEVDDSVAAKNYTEWYIVPYAVYRENCSNYKIEMTYVPDDWFEEALRRLGYDNAKDDSIPTLGIRKIKTLDITNFSPAIRNLTGIEAFESLEELNCSANQITTLDLSFNTKLKRVICNSNGMTTLNLGNNINLITIDASNNKLQELNLEANINLTNLMCSYNQFTSLNLKNLHSLNWLSCNNNLLEYIDLSENKELRVLYCYVNNLTHLDLNSNIKLSEINCQNNNLNFVSIKNLESIPDQLIFCSLFNPNLYCIEVDSLTANSTVNWKLDSWTSLNEHCSCTFSLATSSKNYSSQQFVDSVFVYTSSNCAWSSAENCDWVTVLSEDSMTGEGYLVYLINENNSPDERACELTVAGEKFAIYQSGKNCSYNLFVSSKSYNSENIIDSVLLSTDTNCEWTATENCEWISIISGESGIGDGSVIYSIEENLEPEKRTCEILVAGNIFTVTQNGINCEYTLSNTSKNYTSDNVNDSVYVSTNESCAWTVKNSCDWVTLVSEETHAGSSYIIYNLNENPDTSSRSCELWIAEQPYMIYQDGKLQENIDITTDEYMSLVELYNSCGGTNWNTNTNWLDTVNTTVSNWQGVTVRNGHVVGLDLSNMNLEGEIYDIFSAFDSLEWVNLSGNNLSGPLPTFNGSKSYNLLSVEENGYKLSYLNIANNRFMFSDLEPVADELFAIDTFIYAPQQIIGELFDTAIYKYENINISIKDYSSGLADLQNWYKNETLTIVNIATYSIVNAALEDSGIYRLEVVHPYFPELTLESAPYKLSVMIPVGINDATVQNIKIYPNPAEKRVFIDTQNKVIELKIFNVTGMNVLDIDKFTSGWINIEEFPKGIYFFRIKENNLVLNTKVVFR